MGERDFGFIRQERKGDPKWLPALRLGKTFSNDVHLLAHEGVVFVSRSIPRVRDNFQLKMLGNIEVGPWDHGMASLGQRLFHSRRNAGPDPIPALNLEDFCDEARQEAADDGENARGEVVTEAALVAAAVTKKVLSSLMRLCFQGHLRMILSRMVLRKHLPKGFQLR